MIIQNLSEEIQKLAVQQNGNAIQWIDNPSEEVQRLAVQQNGRTIQLIDNPSEEIQQLAVQQNGNAIQWIDNPSEEVKKLAVQRRGWVIRHIDNPSEEVQRLAVKQEGMAIRFIKNPSEEIQQLASSNYIKLTLITIKDALTVTTSYVVTYVNEFTVARKIHNKLKDHHLYYSVNELNVMLFKTEEDAIFDKINNLSSIHPIDDYYNLLEKKILIYGN